MNYYSLNSVVLAVCTVLLCRQSSWHQIICVWHD